MPPSSLATRRTRRKHSTRTAPPRQARARAHLSDSSDEDFEIDDSSSSLELEDNDDGSVSEESALEESDLEDEEEVKPARSLPKSGKRARRSGPSSAARGSRKRIASSDGGESSLHPADSGAEEGNVQQRSRGRSRYGVSRRNAYIDVDSDEGSEKRKGKQKVVEMEVEEIETRMQITEEKSAMVCGICLSEEGVIERGKLDCCDHFFCFGCIMVWAKVESRCPMCKQRFAAIVRPSLGVSKRTRTVRIPLRDQVYVPPDDEVPVDDPYSDTVCMECHETGEEGLLLLCDHCDSAAHTYCVGLGRSVPRGDWFCRSCQIVVAEEISGSEYEEEEPVLDLSDDDDEDVLRAIVASIETGSQRTARHTRTQRASTSATRPTVSSGRTRRARSVVRRQVRRRRIRSGRRRNRSTAAPRLSQAARDLMRNTESAGDRHLHTLDTQAGPARTVPQQRRLQERIQIMRNNWERIQQGALEFKAIGLRSTAAVQEVTNVDIGNIVTQATQSPNDLHSTEENRSSVLLNVSSNSVGSASARESFRHDKSELKQAWRMMEQAKNLSTGCSTMNAQQSLAGIQQDLRVVPKQMLGRVRQTAGSTMKASAGFNGRASSSTIFITQSPDVKKMGTFVASSRTDNRDNIHLENPVGNRGLEIIARSMTDRGKLLGEADSREQLKKCNVIENSSSSGPVIHASFADAGECSKQQLTYGAICSSATKDKETGLHTSVVDCSGQEIASQENGHYNLVSLEKPRATKQDGETGKVHTSGKEHGNLEHSNHSAHLPSHASVDRVRDTAHEEHASAAGRDRNGRRLSTNIFHAEKEHLVNAAASGSLVRQKGKTESLKDQLTHMVKTELWPLYLSEGLGKDQFKEIARSSVHTLLDLCGPLNGNSNPNQFRSLSCGHVELQHKSLISGCCDNCFKSEVENVVRTAKAKLQASLFYFS